MLFKINKKRKAKRDYMVLDKDFKTDYRMPSQSLFRF